MAFEKAPVALYAPVFYRLDQTQLDSWTVTSHVWTTRKCEVHAVHIYARLGVFTFSPENTSVAL